MKDRFLRLLEMLDLLTKRHIYNGELKDFHVKTTSNNANDSWFFDIEFLKPIDIEDFKQFAERIKLLPRKVKGVKYVSYKISYKELNYDQLEEYYDYVIRGMAKRKPRYSSIIDFDINRQDNKIDIIRLKDATYVNELLPELKRELLRFGFDCEFTTSITTEAETITERMARQDRIFRNEVLQNTEASPDEIHYLNLENKLVRGVKHKISDIPKSEPELNEYKSANDKAVFSLEAEIVKTDMRKINSETDLYTFIITDGEDSIYVKKWVKEPKDREFIKGIKAGMNMKLKGVAQYDKFTGEIVIVSNIIEYTSKVVPKDTRRDLQRVKRIELHAHTKMSTLDGIDSVKDIVSQAKKWGHKAIAITDHGNVQAYPELYKATKDESIKPIYGAEFTFVEEENYQIVKNPKDIPFENAVYTVFDIETTGLSVLNDKIIEIAAVKIKDNHVIEEYQTYVNPKRQLSMLTTKLTSIKNSDVIDAPLIDTVIHEFYEFSKDTILVAHNAQFDVGFIENEYKNHNISFNPITSIDTLSIARNCYSNDLKRFNLKAVSRFFKVELTQHHRAIYDTRATADVFLHMLRDARKTGINNINDFNELSVNGPGYKHVISKHINILARNEVGLRNLFHITSLANTEYFYREARVLKSVLEKNREGLLVGSGCMNSALFEVALNKSYEELKRKARYYDFLEIQPITDFSHLADDMENWSMNILRAQERIIKAGEELGILVVATGDVHHITKEDAKYRDIYVQTPVVGGGLHPLARYKEIPSQYFRTTDEMLQEFKHLSEDKRVEVVITNTHKINDLIEFVKAFKPTLYAPTDDFLALDGIPSVENKLIKMVSDRSKEIYGEDIPKLVKDRIDKEIKSITSNKFSTVYYISHLLVKKSLDEGYLVGSRGSVGSSLVATLMDITEVNPLPPHYVCPKCFFSTFKMTNEEKSKYSLRQEEERLQVILDKVESGFDLPKEECPVCGHDLNKEGHGIPFETFLGFKGDKVPDIDLNFSGDYQPVVHEYIRTIFGHDRAFRAGTISTVAEKTAFGYVKGYLERKNLQMRKAEIERRAARIVGVKKSTGQHPGGIVVVPNYKEIIDVTPVQFPADQTTATWRTTHFDYHSFEDNLFKLDVLGHDDPTMIRYLMDYVKEHQDEFPFTEATEIPMDDPNVYKLLSGTDIIGLTKEDLRGSEVSSFGIPEMGTKFVRDMLTDSRPNNFADAVKISGLSHGTDVWLNNAKSLVTGHKRYGTIPFKDVIGCRDDIMVSLISWGMKEATAFEISEFIRKGKAAGNKQKWEMYKQIMQGHKIPDWYIWSCGQIKYMFPKAHATAYVMMAMRIAWFKVYKPILFYSAYFSKRASDFDVYAMQGGEYEISKKMYELEEKTKIKKISETEKRLYTVLELANEMVKRGFTFRPIDIEKSHSRDFVIHEDGKSLILPFITVDGLGLKVADSIVLARQEEPFKSKDDVQSRTSLSKTLFTKLEMLNVFDHLPDNSQMNLFDF